MSALLMVAVLAAASEIGFRAGRRSRDAPGEFRSLMSGIGAAMFGLLGLLLGFALSMAIARWDARRAVLVDEANAIGTLWLRAGFCDQLVRGELESSLRKYAASSIALGTAGDDLESRRALRKESAELHADICSALERSGSTQMSNAERASLITAANAVIDIHEVRLASIENHLPASLVVVLLAVAAVAVHFLSWSCGTVGKGGRVAMMSLGLLVGAVLFPIMDVNRPQRGALSVGIESLERIQATISR